MSEILLREEVEDGVVQVTQKRPERLDAPSQRLIAELRDTGEPTEAFSAFVEKRTPRWKV